MINHNNNHLMIIWKWSDGDKLMSYRAAAFRMIGAGSGMGTWRDQ